jgi:hypothetical protein
MTITGIIEQAPKGQYYMTDCLSGDLIFRSILDNNWMFGYGSNTSSLFKINSGKTSISTPTISLSGNVGISRDNPAYSLDVGGDINFTGSLRSNGQLYSPSPWLSNTTSPDVYFTAGSVAIGKTAPNYKLDVAGSMASASLYTSNIYSYGTGSTNTLNIGTDTNAATINIGSANSTINLAGMLSVLSTTDLYVDDRKITLNYGGASNSSGDSGFEIQEGGSIKGYIKTSSDRNSFLLRTPTGTTDMTLDLSGKAVNINAGSLVIDSNNNIGIGKTNPAYKLDVAGIINGTALYVGGAPYIGSQWTTYECNVYITTSNIGIGTTAPGNSKLRIASTATKKLQFTNDTTMNRHIVLYETADNEHQFSGIGVNAGIFKNQLDASTSAYTWNVAASTTTSSELMRLTGTGNMGIGIVPSYKLDVNGVANVSDKLYVTNNIGLGVTNPSEKLHISAGNIAMVHGGAYGGTASADKWISVGDKSLVAGPQFQMSNYGMAVTWDTDGCFFGLRDYGTDRKDTIINYGNDAAENLIFMTKSNNELMRLSGSGQLGIGKTPAYPLDVNGIINAGALYVAGAPYIGSQWTTNSNSTCVSISSSNIGINTTTPLKTLHVAGDVQIDNSLYLGNKQLQIQGLLITKRTGTGAANITSTLYPNGYYWDSATSNVGIGTVTPSYPLHVQGSIYSSADIFAYSDARYKHNLSQIKGSVDKLKSLTGYTFDVDDDTIRHTGLLAQDVDKVLPEAVTTSRDGKLGLAYGNLAGLFVEALKEIDLRLSALEGKFGL